MMRLLLLFAVLLAAPALALDSKDMQQELQRYDQIMGKLKEDNDRLMGQVRELQRANEALHKQIAAFEEKQTVIIDRMQRIENVDVYNAQAANKQLADRLAAHQQGVYEWGTQTRNCPELSLQHQQISTRVKPDGSRTVRVLCFDGKIVHLGTEVHAGVE